MNTKHKQMEDTSHRIASLEEHVPSVRLCRDLKEEAGLSSYGTTFVWASGEWVDTHSEEKAYILMTQEKRGNVISPRDEDLPAPTATKLVKLIREMDPDLDLPHDPDGLAVIYLALKAEVDANGFLSHKQNED